MMQRILTFLLCCWLSTCYALPEAAAVTWLKLFQDGAQASYYLDIDSFQYDATANQGSCSYKLEDQSEATDYIVNARFDFQKKKSALQQLVVYRDGEEILREKYPELHYEKVHSGTNEHYIYELLRLAKDATDQQLLWEFNNMTLPTPAPWNSSSWESFTMAGVKNAAIDRSTTYKKTTDKGAWFRFGNLLQYYRFNLENGRAAIYAHRGYQNGQLVAAFSYPIVFWTDNGSSYTSRSQKMITREAAICFRMEKGVQLDN